MLCAVVAGALVIVGSVVATAPPLEHADITNIAATRPAGLNLIVIRRPPERIAFISGLHPLGLSPNQGPGRSTPFSGVLNPFVLVDHPAAFRCHGAWNSTTGTIPSTAVSKRDTGGRIAMARIRIDDPSGASNR